MSDGGMTVADADGARRAAAVVAPDPTRVGGLVQLAQELIRIDTTNPPGRELEAAALIARRLAAAGIEVELQTFDEDRANLVARLRGTGGSPGLMLSGHLDTVPVDESAWTVPPHAGLVRDGRLWGRGAVDMKGAVAAMVVALERLRQSGQPLSGDLVLALTAGEETDSVGAERLCDAGLLDGIGTAVIGEPTDLGVGIAHRGALWVRVAAAGASAHGAQPTAGANAVRALLEWLHPLDSIEQLADGSNTTHGAGGVSLNVIGGGSAPNVIPDQAHAVLDFRTVRADEHDEILRALRARAGDVELTVLRDAPPISTVPDDELVRTALAAVEGAGLVAETRRMPYVTDGSIFASRLGIRAVVVGPGAETVAHCDDESVAIADLAAAAHVYESMARRLLDL